MSEVSFCQTISYNADNFEYEAVSQENGNATVIKFPLDQKLYSPAMSSSFCRTAKSIFTG
jgi:hypothetical protein